MTDKLLKGFPYEYNRLKSNILDATRSVLRNIAEGYCRKSPKEYLNFLNIALGSSGELHSGMISFEKIGLLTKENFDEFDKLHYKTENELLKLAESIQTKIKNNSWDDQY